MSDDLKPCPFCGRDGSEDNATQEAAVIIQEVSTAIGKKGWQVKCACGAMTGKELRWEAAAHNWNRRADLPTSPDLQAEAERVFADVQLAVLVEDAKAEIAKALQAAKDEEREICALICEAMASTDSEWPEADAALRRAAKNIRGA